MPLNVYYIHCIFIIYGLFKHAVSISGYVALNGRKIIG
jgi:hypothetical protein